MTLVVNLYGGPGTGKSTTAAAVFAELKTAGVNTELVTEYAKDKVWEQSTHILGNQIYLLGKQFHRLWRLKDQVDVIVTDSPILLLMEYGKEWGPTYRKLVREAYDHFDHNMDVFLKREKAYNPKGRLQTEEKAKALDTTFFNVLMSSKIDFKVLPANREATVTITRDVLESLQLHGSKV